MRATIVATNAAGKTSAFSNVTPIVLAQGERTREREPAGDLRLGTCRSAPHRDERRLVRRHDEQHVQLPVGLVVTPTARHLLERLRRDRPDVRHQPGRSRHGDPRQRHGQELDRLDERDVRCPGGSSPGSSRPPGSAPCFAPARRSPTRTARWALPKGSLHRQRLGQDAPLDADVLAPHRSCDRDAPEQGRPRDERRGLQVHLPPSASSPRHGTLTLTASQLAAMLRGGTYVNVHTAKNTRGEIRGQITRVN